MPNLMQADALYFEGRGTDGALKNRPLSLCVSSQYESHRRIATAVASKQVME